MDKEKRLQIMYAILFDIDSGFCFEEVIDRAYDRVKNKEEREFTRKIMAHIIHKQIIPPMSYEMGIKYYYIPIIKRKTRRR